MRRKRNILELLACAQYVREKLRDGDPKGAEAMLEHVGITREELNKVLKNHLGEKAWQIPLT